MSLARHCTRRLTASATWANTGMSASSSSWGTWMVWGNHGHLAAAPASSCVKVRVWSTSYRTGPWSRNRSCNLPWRVTHIPRRRTSLGSDSTSWNWIEWISTSCLAWSCCSLLFPLACSIPFQLHLIACSSSANVYFRPDSCWKPLRRQLLVSCARKSPIQLQRGSPWLR